MPDRDPASLLDIAVAAGRIGEFIAGVDAETFRRDVKTQSAVVFQLLVIGEATKRLSAEVRDRLPVVP